MDFFKNCLIVAISFFAVVAVAQAGSLTPLANPGASGYTLGDIYTRLTTNAAAGAHSFAPGATPAGSLHSLSDIYNAIPAIDAAKIKSGTGYLGVDGSLLPAGGNATTSDVCSGKTFFGASQSDWNTQTGALSIDPSKMLSTAAYCGVSGTITDGSNVSGGNGSLTFNIPTGYYSGKTCTAADSGLVSSNIKSGAAIFGVSGSSTVVDTATGNAAASDMLSGKTAFVNGALVTGNVTAGSSATGSNGSLSMTIPDGLYSGSKTCTAGDTSLAAGNIKFGATIFGTAGSFKSKLPDTGLTVGNTTTFGEDPDYTSANSTVCDRVASGADTSFTDNGDGTITDNCTNLQWKKCSEGLSGPSCGTGSAGTYTWEQALAQCEGLDFGNHTDWRLPNINELLSILNYSGSNPAVNGTYFPATAASAYWTSTDPSSAAAWIIDFSYGATAKYLQNNNLSVRCVRG